MDRKALTLIELLAALMIAGFLVLVMTCQFVAEQKMRAVVNNQNAAVNEASMAMTNMEMVLRFVIPSTINNPSPYTSISARIEAATPSHLSFIADGASPTATFSQAGSTITYGLGGPTTVIARNIAYFYVYYDSTTKEIILRVTATVPYPATQRSRSSSLETRILVLPD